jgi:transposase
VTAIYDKDRDVIADIRNDRKSEAMEKWLLNRPSVHHAAVKTVSMDMWDPYIPAVKNMIPDTMDKICFIDFMSPSISERPWTK